VTAQNRVLQLDGDGDYVELPPNIFSALLDIAAIGVGGGWYSEIQAKDDHPSYGYYRPLVLNAHGGNVGIGTTNPLGRLHVEDPHVSVYTSEGPSGGWSKDGLTIFANPNAGYSVLKISSDHSNVGDRGLLHIYRAGAQPEECLYVQMDGDVGIGTTNPLGRLHVEDYQISVHTSQGSSGGWTKDGLTIFANPDAGYSVLKISSDHSNVGDRGLLHIIRGDQDCLYVRMNGDVGIGTKNPGERLDVNGTVRAHNFIPPSDVRLKKEITPINNPLEKTTQLRGVNYKWINEEMGEGMQMGVIAQEVEAIIPEVVFTDDEGYKSVAYNKLVAVLIESIKELKAENEALKRSNEKTTAELENLKTRIAQIELALQELQER